MIKKYILLFCLLVGSCLLFAQTDSSHTDVAETRDSAVYIPMDLQDCLRQLDILIPDSVRDNIRQMEEQTFCTNAHFGLGMWIRNHWQLWGQSRLWTYFHKLGLSHPDDISDLILQSYHRYLNGKPLNIRPYIQKTKQYWKNIQSENQKKTRQNSRAYNKALKKFQLWDTQAVHNWEDCKQLLGLPMTDSITGSCVRFRNLGDTLGPEELSYVEQHRASVAVIPYENNYNFLVPLESYNNDWNEFDDMLPHKGHLKKVIGTGQTDRDVPFTYRVSYSKEGQITDKWVKLPGETWKEVHQYDSLGRRSKVEIYRNDTLLERHTYTYHSDTYLWNIEKRARNASELLPQLVSYSCTMDKDGRVIQEEKIMPDSISEKMSSDLCLIQYDQKGRLTNRLFYKNKTLRFYSSNVYDDSKNISYSFDNVDVEYNDACWISLLSKYGDKHYFTNLDNYGDIDVEFLWNYYYWQYFRYDRYGNMTRNIVEDDGQRTQVMKCRIRYW